MSFNPIFIKCKFSTSCSLCVRGELGVREEGRGCIGKGHPSTLLNLGLGSRRPSPQVSSGRRKSLAEGQTQTAGAARILPAPRAPFGPLPPRPVLAEVREPGSRIPHLRRGTRQKALSPGTRASPREGCAFGGPRRPRHRSTLSGPRLQNPQLAWGGRWERPLSPLGST